MQDLMSIPTSNSKLLASKFRAECELLLREPIVLHNWY